MHHGVAAIGAACAFSGGSLAMPAVARTSSEAAVKARYLPRRARNAFVIRHAPFKKNGDLKREHPRFLRNNENYALRRPNTTSSRIDQRDKTECDLIMVCIGDSRVFPKNVWFYEQR
jgi:hypothetical protein